MASQRYVGTECTVALSDMCIKSPCQKASMSEAIPPSIEVKNIPPGKAPMMLNEQPNSDMHARCSEGSAASAKGVPENVTSGLLS